MRQHPFSLIFVFAAGLAAGLVTHANAQQAERIGDYIVHYNTINTNLLPPDVARAYGIQRAASRALLNVAVLRASDEESTMDTPSMAEVTASAINLSRQRRAIPMQEVADQDAIYYIGTFRIHDEEMLDFTIRVKPIDSDTEAREIRFRQQFFVD